MSTYEDIEVIIKNTDSILFEEVKNKHFSVDKKIKNNLSPPQFGKIIYNCLKECLTDDSEKYSGIPNVKKLANRSSDFLLNILVNSPFEYFKEAVGAFEKIVNTKNINGKTPLFHSILLKSFGIYDLTKKEKKIEYICASYILNSQNNLCDLETDKNTDDFYLPLSEYYSRIVIDALNVMSKFYKNETILKNYFPKIDTRHLVSFDAAFSINPTKIAQIKLNKLDPDLLVEKFSVPFLKELQYELKSGSFKKELNQVLSTQLNINEQTILLLEPLFFELDIKHFKTLKTMYTDLLETITYEKILQLNIKKREYIYRIEQTPENKKIAKKYGISIESKRNLTNEDLWSIVSVEKKLCKHKQIKTKKTV